MKLFSYLLAIGIAAYILQLITGYNDITRKIYFAIVFVCSVEILRVVYLAIKRKKSNAWVIGAGVSVFVAGVLIVLIYVLIGGQFNNNYILFILLFSIPLSMSVFLARSSSQTNKDLALQLKNVKELSAKELEQKLRAQKAESENERKTKELEEARQLQLSMLPKVIPTLPNLDIAVSMETATEVGGDYYDFHVRNDGTLTAVIGDATGHGTKAGTMVTITKSLFNSLAFDEDILSTFSKISRVIKDMKLRRLSMCLLLLKIKGARLFLSSAAMPPALIYRKKNQAVEEIIMKGMPLGVINDFPYTLNESKLYQGDTILLLSDGFPELKNDIDEMYGYERTKMEFQLVGEKEPKAIVEYLKKSASEWVNRKEPDDDVTFVVIKVK